MRGSIRQFVLFDVADEIKLDVLRAVLDIAHPERAPAFSRPAPDYVRFEQPPVVEPLLVDNFEARAKYYQYGVVSIEIDEQFSLGCGLSSLSAPPPCSPTRRSRTGQWHC